MSKVERPAAAPPGEADALASMALTALWQATAPVIVCDARFRPSFLNGAGREMADFPADADVDAYALEDFLVPDDRALLADVVLPTLTSEGRWDGVLRFRRFTGPERSTAAHWSAFALRDAAGDLTGAAAFTTDVTARDKAERELRRQQTERRAFEENLERSEARLRAAMDLAGLGVYAWNPVTGALEWDERLRAMWGLAPDTVVDMDVFEAGIHPDDRACVQAAIAACIDPAGDGRYVIEYRVRGQVDGAVRHIATSGRTTFTDGRAVGFIGAAIDVTAQRRAEAAIHASEAQFRSFAAHSSNLIWIVDPAAGAIVYRSAAYERIWGMPSRDGPTELDAWMKDVHPDDRRHVGSALAATGAGEVMQFEYRIVRPLDGATRWLRETSFPILDETGAVSRIGGITEDLTQADVRQAYVVSARPAEARRLAALVRALGYRVRTFDSAAMFLDIAPVLAPGCVLVDLRKARAENLAIPRELRARSMALQAIVLDAPAAGVAAAIAAMKAGAVDYIVETGEHSLGASLGEAMANCQGAIRPITRDDNAGARVARLTPREREVLVGLLEGGTNKSIAHKLGISPRTVELHRAQVMSRLNASNLSELLQVALAAGVSATAGDADEHRRAT